jgi:hypothetical protein
MPTFELDRSDEAARQLAVLEADKGLAKPLKAVRKALGLLQLDPNYPGLNVHPYKGQPCPHRGTLLIAYAQNKTPGGVANLLLLPARNEGEDSHRRDHASSVDACMFL